MQAPALEQCTDVSQNNAQFNFQTNKPKGYKMLQTLQS